MKAVGIVRVSQVAGREGESFVSPSEQRSRIEALCEREGFDLIEVVEELDVSGGTPLSERHGLRGAIETIEQGEAQVLVAAYFDRLMRSLQVQGEVVSRVEAAGGRVMAADVGAVSEAEAGQWIQGSVLGLVSEYHRRATKERAGAAQANAVARGVPPYPNIPPGYTRGTDRRLEPSSDAPAIEQAFALRAAGETLKTIRSYLASHGIHRSYHGVQAMLRSRVYLGELRFGELVNPTAHEPIISGEVWRKAQRGLRGPRAKSERLLARLGILRCGTCGSRMVVGTQTQNGRRYPFYRCPPTGDCPRRVTIGAEIAERVVVDAVLERFGSAKGRASAEGRARDAVASAERAQGDLDAAIQAFAGLEAEPAAIDRLRELRLERDRAVEHARHLSGLRVGRVLNLAEDWEGLSPTAKQEIIVAAVEQAVVGLGRGAARITVTLRE